MSVQTIIQSTFFSEKRASDRRASSPLITISGEYGAGGRDIGKLLAKQLGIVCFEPELIDQIVEESMKGSELSHQLDTKLPETLDSWLHLLWHEKAPAQRADYYIHLVKAIMGIVHVGGVIIGRGAHLILAGQKVFRLKVEASRDFCAHAIAKKEGISLKAAKELAERVDAERIKFVREVYKRFPTENTYYDLVLNAETIPPDQMLHIVTHAMRTAGYLMTKPTLDELHHR